jgi:hypothetical protein
MKKSNIKKLLNQFVTDREMLIEITEKVDWKIYATSPNFWVDWSIANIPSKEIKDIVSFIKKDKSPISKQIADTISAVHQDPLRWIGLPDSPDGGEYSMKNILARCGPPV